VVGGIIHRMPQSTDMPVPEGHPIGGDKRKAAKRSKNDAKKGAFSRAPAAAKASSAKAASNQSEVLSEELDRLISQHRSGYLNDSEFGRLKRDLLNRASGGGGDGRTRSSSGSGPRRRSSSDTKRGLQTKSKSMRRRFSGLFGMSGRLDGGPPRDAAPKRSLSTEQALVEIRAEHPASAVAAPELSPVAPSTPANAPSSAGKTSSGKKKGFSFN
jgi:hypothetical protein